MRFHDSGIVLQGFPPTKPEVASADELEKDAAYLKLLEAKQKQLEAAGGGGDGDSDPIFMDDFTDDEETESALDEHDPFGLLVLSMNAMQESHPAQFAVRPANQIAQRTACSIPRCVATFSSHIRTCTVHRVLLIIMVYFALRLHTARPHPPVCQGSQRMQGLVGSLDASQKETLKDFAQRAQIKSANSARSAGKQGFG